MDRTPGKPTTRRYSEVEKAQAVRLVRQLRAELGTEHGTIQRVAVQLGYGFESVRKWVAQSDVDDGTAPGVSSAEAQRVKALEQENRELRRPTRSCARRRLSSRRSSTDYIDGHRHQQAVEGGPPGRPRHRTRPGGSVLDGHGNPEASDLAAVQWAGRSWRVGLSPVAGNKATVPADHRGRLYDQEYLAEALSIEYLREHGEDGAISVGEGGLRHLALQHHELMAERQDLRAALIAGGQQPTQPQPPTD